MASLTWLGHSAFLLESDERKSIYIDPFLNGNPKTPESLKQPERVDVIAVTHGHSDHVGDTVELSRAFPQAQVVCQVELKGWLGGQGALVADQLPGLNKGGTQDVGGVHFTLVNAFHSSSSNDLEYLGESCGIVIRLEGGRAIYFAGDTCVFGDMALIAPPLRSRLRRPADRRPLHYGAARGRRCARAAREPALHPLPLRDLPAPRRDARAAPGRGSERDGARPRARRDARSLRCAPSTYSIAACDLDARAVGRRDAVEVPRRRLGRPLGAPGRRRRRDAGLREPALRPRRARAARAGAGRRRRSSSGSPPRTTDATTASSASSTRAAAAPPSPAPRAWTGPAASTGDGFAAQGNILVSADDRRRARRVLRRLGAGGRWPSG